MNNTVLRAESVARELGVSRATIWNWANPKSRHHRPDFPKPIKLSENITGWLSSEIEEYLGKLAAKREERAN
ncbi:AlpA family phage regulatory protein [Neisseria sp. DTU_2020_1000833_1_SI_GRL_NUU_006]|nr:AlpA family phage regulatory protein [Neisseria sp. DTU_2020_1000833_1_SI_GRL_NUU_006]